MMTRRRALQTTALLTAAATAPVAFGQPDVVPKQKQTLISTAPAPFKLPPLPYAVDALEPHLDARTMEIHHDRHHQAYVDNLNKAVAEFPEMGKEPVEVLLMNLNSAVPEKVRAAIRNHGGGHYNHSLFWQTMKKDGGGEPKGELKKSLDKFDGGFDGFKKAFGDMAGKVFGSGWVWLVMMPDKSLGVTARPNQDSPISDKSGGKTIVPLLGLDVWEHAYYLKYQNKRADYVAAWWNVVNWDFVAERFARRG
ncbi:MAG: superoxide dismutase [Verrucomicrobia bacterium]|nr:MAG: superoxide dismutase [Verrucomicrobiota bacterium]